MIMINEKAYTHAYTHGGKFHADDVACAALIRIIDPYFPIERGFSPPDDPDCIVFDIGNGEFDHHKVPKEVRPNGTAYAAFGKLWRVLQGGYKLTEEQMDRFDLDIVQPFDIADNTGRMNPLSELITSMNPFWNETEENISDRQFFLAVNQLTLLFCYWFDKAVAVQSADATAAEAIARGVPGIAVADYYIPSQAFHNGTFFAVSPSQRGGWQALALKQSNGKQMLFPAAWRGAAPLQEGVTFCHAGGFIAAFQTKEQAIAACTKVIDYFTRRGFLA